MIKKKVGIRQFRIPNSDSRIKKKVMALKYSLVLRPDLSKEAQAGDKLFFGQVRATDRISFVELCEALASYSTASSGDVKLVLDGLVHFMRKNLQKGNIIEVGELGNFRMTAGSAGSFSKEEFSTTMFKKGKIIFTPGRILREACAAPTFEKLTFVPGTAAPEQS